MLKIDNITIAYKDVPTVVDFSLDMAGGQIVSLVGESGSGKTTVIRAVLGLLAGGGKVTRGDILFNGKSLLKNTQEQWRNLRGSEISMIFQDSGAMMNPTRKIGAVFTEYLQTHEKISKKDAWAKGEEMLEKMRLPSPDNIMRSYPFQLSGGMRQRVGIAMGMTYQPKLLLADEPTSALDVTTQAQIVRQMAERLNKEEDAAHYLELEEKIKEAVLNEFFTPSGRLAIDTQAAYVIALKFQVYRDRSRIVEQFKGRLKQDMYQIKCGFVGAPLLCTVLAEAGEYELAYDFLLKEGFPSWLYSVNLGATTVWERWNSVMPDGTISDTGMNSLNHYAYGSVMEFVYAYAAGIRPAEEGFRKAVIAPHPDVRIPEIACSYDSVSGRYVCNWKIEKDGKFRVHIEIPFNCEAEVKLPGYEKEVMTLAAGNYDFIYQPEKDLRKPYGRHTTLARIAKNGQAMGILGKYTPALAGIAASGDPEMGSNSLEELSHIGFLPFDPAALETAIGEISDLTVEV